jgi:hypothetical protein
MAMKSVLDHLLADVKSFLMESLNPFEEELSWSPQAAGIWVIHTYQQQVG